MAYKDLREYIAALEERGLLRRITAEVDPELEITEITDRISKQCLVLQQEYGLSTRETEVCEAIARGLSMATIAERLFISENTVRTHSRHIYAKLDIHSRQELGAMLQEM